MNPPAIRVVAGVWIEAGRVFVQKRPLGKHLAGRWEFPGGKCEDGESDESALQRELKEELGIHAKIGECLGEISHAYPDRRVTLILYSVFAARPEEGFRPLADHLFADAETLGQLDFCPADVPLLERVAQALQRDVGAHPS